MPRRYKPPRKPRRTRQFRSFNADAYRNSLHPPHSHRDIDNAPSVMAPTPANANKPVRHQYTGDQVVGFATMHKSNTVPITNTQQGKDIGNMRRTK